MFLYALMRYLFPNPNMFAQHMYHDVVLMSTPHIQANKILLKRWHGGKMKMLQKLTTRGIKLLPTNLTNMQFTCTCGRAKLHHIVILGVDCDLLRECTIH